MLSTFAKRVATMKPRAVAQALLIKNGVSPDLADYDGDLRMLQSL